MLSNPKREDLYRRLALNIGNTPLYEVKNIKIPNGNRIFAKEEFLNPTGSHYDRVFWNLLYSLERQGTVCPCQGLVETTSGNAGASFAWLCAALGYKATVIIPEDMPDARVAHIRSFGAHIIVSPKGEYVSGSIQSLHKYLKDKKALGESDYCPNHAGSEFSVVGMSQSGEEIVRDAPSAGIDKVDIYVSALGGGITVRGVGEVLQEKWPEMQIVGVEPFEAPEYYVRRFPERFESIYGETPTRKPHGLLGIGRWGDDSYKFPHMEKMLARINDIILVKKEHWFEAALMLRNIEAKHVGRTSAASLWAALELAKEVEDKTLLVLFYDPAWKYLNLI
jgi:cysteine synthase A